MKFPMDKNIRILIVDDFSTMRRIVKNLLNDLGFFNTSEADDGHSALAELRKAPFDLVITDWNMVAPEVEQHIERHGLYVQTSADPRHMSPVTYVDSATIGCLMDMYRQITNAGGHLKLSGVQKRVQTMLTMTGAQNFIDIHDDEPQAVKSFGV